MDAPKMRTMKFEKAVVLACMLFAIYNVAFVATHRPLVLNRYRDSWSRIPAADEYLQTRTFAKDPFYKEAPPFAQFGLMEFLNAHLCRLTGWNPMCGFWVLLVLNTALFSAGNFLAGYLATRNTVAACVSMAVVPIVIGGEAPIGTGFPFYTALSWFGVFLVCLWGVDGENRERVTAYGSLTPVRGHARALCNSFAIGLFAGVLFDLHAFVGVLAFAATVTTTLIECPYLLLIRNAASLKATAMRLATFTAGFTLTAWRWVLLQLQLRPYLSKYNAHMLTAMEHRGLYMYSGLFALALGTWAMCVRVSCRREWRWLVPYLALGSLTILFGATRMEAAVSRFVGKMMADRLPLFCPLGPMSAIAFMEWKALLAMGKLPHRSALMCMLMPVIGAGITYAYGWARGHVGLIRRAYQYKEHPYAFLTSVGTNWHGKVILSDPWTSLCARELTGAYAVCVPSVEASPAVDHDARARLALSALIHGPGELTGSQVDAVLVVKSHSRFLENYDSPGFSELQPQEILAVWTNAGWKIEHNTDEMICLIPGK